VVGQIHAPVALLPGKEPQLSIGQGSVWASEPVWTLWWRKKQSLLLSGIEPRSSSQ